MHHALSGSAAASCANVSPVELAELNPAIDSAVFRGRGNLPRGYLLRVPPGTSGSFEQRLAQLASDERVVAEPARRRGATRTARAEHVQRHSGRHGKKSAVRTASAEPSYRTHRVAQGQTLSHIADRYGVSVDRIKSTNRLRGSAVKSGQVLKIPRTG